MKFSVLMSVYKREKPEYLKQSIQSVLNQTLLPSEIVIVKDGELTIELTKIIEDYKNNYKDLFKIIEIKKNVGLGRALNKGILNCKYDIVARMDTDDICRKDRFEKQVRLLKADKSLSIVGSWISEFNESIDDIISNRIVPSNNEEIKLFCKRRNPFNHMTVMYRKKDVLECGNYEHFPWNEDYKLWINMIYMGKKAFNIPESLVYARVNKDLFKRRGGLEYAKMDIKIQRDLLNKGMINKIEFIKNSILKSMVRIMPNNIRQYVYLKVIRKL